MLRMTATELKNNFGQASDAAMKEPVVITSHQRDKLVLISADEFKRLKGNASNDDSESTVTDEMKARIQRTLATHHDTIVDLANR